MIISRKRLFVSAAAVRFTSRVVAAAFVAMMFVGMPLGEAQAGKCRAGVVKFPSGKKGIYVNHPNFKLPHSVVVQPTNTAGYSTISACTYFNVLKHKTTQFQVQHKRCDNGLPIATDVNISLYWIMCRIP